MKTYLSHTVIHDAGGRMSARIVREISVPPTALLLGGGQATNGM